MTSVADRDALLERIRGRAAGYDERNEFFFEDLEELAALRDTGPAPWAGGERHLHLRLRWDELTGRQIGPTGTLVAGATTYDAATRTATLDPTASLAATTTYTATVTGVRDTAGNLIDPVAVAQTRTFVPSRRAVGAAVASLPGQKGHADGSTAWPGPVVNCTL